MLVLSRGSLLQVIDAAGNMVSSADNNITFTVSGQGSIYGVGNGDPSDHDPDKAEYRKAYKGLARVLVQSTVPSAADAGAGAITLTATAGGLAKGTMVIKLSQ